MDQVIKEEGMDGSEILILTEHAVTETVTTTEAVTAAATDQLLQGADTSSSSIVTSEVSASTVQLSQATESSPRPIVTGGTGTVNALIRCPPYCRSNCVVKHHPLLVAILNCVDTPAEHYSLMDLKLKVLQSVVNKYEEAGGWHQDAPVPDSMAGYQYPLIHWACSLGRVGAAIWLVGHGLDPQVQAVNQKSETGLHRALMCLQESCPKEANKKFRQLLSVMEPALGIQNAEGNTPIHMCCDMMRNYMPRVSFYQDCLHAMITKAQLSDSWTGEEISRVLALQNPDGDTALHHLCWNDEYINHVIMLVNAGADIFIKNKMGHGPIINARMGNSICITRYLENVAMLKSSDMTQTPGTGNPVTSSRYIFDSRGIIIGQEVHMPPHKSSLNSPCSLPRARSFTPPPPQVARDRDMVGEPPLKKANTHDISSLRRLRQGLDHTPQAEVMEHKEAKPEMCEETNQEMSEDVDDRQLEQIEIVIVEADDFTQMDNDSVSPNDVPQQYVTMQQRSQKSEDPETETAATDSVNPQDSEVSRVIADTSVHSPAVQDIVGETPTEDAKIVCRDERYVVEEFILEEVREENSAEDTRDTSMLEPWTTTKSMGESEKDCTLEEALYNRIPRPKEGMCTLEILTSIEKLLKSGPLLWKYMESKKQHEILEYLRQAPPAAQSKIVQIIIDDRDTSLNWLQFANSGVKYLQEKFSDLQKEQEECVHQILSIVETLGDLQKEEKHMEQQLQNLNADIQKEEMSQDVYQDRLKHCEEAIQVLKDIGREERLEKLEQKKRLAQTEDPDGETKEMDGYSDR